MTDSQILYPLNDNIGSVELVRISGSDLDIVNAARVSYGKESTKFEERDMKLLSYLIEHKHTTPFEHNSLTFRIKCPLFVARQWMRHRIASYNEISYRYVEVPEEFYVPNEWRYQDKKNRQGSVGQFTDEQLKEQYKESLKVALNMYKTLLEKGVAREMARFSLPVSTYTEFFYTCNLHSLLHFLELRMEKSAQYEIRQYANCIYQVVEKHFPTTMKLWREKHKNLFE